MCCHSYIAGAVLLVHLVYMYGFQKEVDDALDTLCSLVPGGLGDQCKSLIDDYFPVIWSLLQQEVVSGALCSEQCKS